MVEYTERFENWWSSKPKESLIKIIAKLDSEPTLDELLKIQAMYFWESFCYHNGVDP